MRVPSLGRMRLLHSSRIDGISCQLRSSLRSASTNHHNHNHDKSLQPEDEDPWANIKVEPELRKARYNDFPLPHGSWQENYDRKQKLRNWQLGIGVALFDGSVAYVIWKDPWNFEKAFGPRKYMHNPPAFESPLLEPNVITAGRIELEKAYGVLPADLKSQMSSSQIRPENTTSSSSVAEPARRDLSHVDFSKLPEIPNHVPYLIVGGGTAAFAAFRAIRANNPKATVLVVTQESHNPYMRPPLTKELWFSEESSASQFRFKQFSGKERSVFFEPDEFFLDPKTLNLREDGGVAVLRNHKVTKIDPTHQKVQLDNGWEIYYDRCLLATGARPRSLPALEAGGKDVMDRVTLYRRLDDFVRVDVASRSAKKIAVVGGGFLGSEISCSLARRGKSAGFSFEVHQIFPEKGNLGRILPEYLSSWLSQKMQRIDGVHVHPNTFVTKSSFADGQVILHLNNGEQVSADHVVVAVGVTPNTDLAVSGEMEVDEEVGGFKVNSELEARKNVWVAGDAASFFDVILGRRRIEHHDHAVATGRLAGENMLGKGKPFWHQSMFWSDIGPDVGFEAVGLVDSSLETVGVFAKDGNIVENGENPSNYSHLELPDPGGQYSKGVIFYMQNKIVVGILLWNVFNHVSVARKIIKDQRSFADLSEVAKLFNLHDSGDNPDDEQPDKKNEQSGEADVKNETKKAQGELHESAKNTPTPA